MEPIKAYGAFARSLSEVIGARRTIQAGALSFGTAIAETLAISLALPLLQRLLGTHSSSISVLKNTPVSDADALAWTIPLLIAFGALSIGRVALALWKTQVLTGVRLDYVHNVRCRLFESAALADWAQSRNVKPSRIQSILTMEADRLESGITFALETPGQLAVIVGYGCVALAISPVMTACALAAFLIAYPTSRVGRQHSERLGERLSGTYDAYFQTIREFIAGLRVIKIFGREAAHTAQFRSDSAEVNRVIRDFARHNATSLFWKQVATGVAGLAFLTYSILWSDLSAAETLVLALLIYRVAPMVQAAEMELHQVLNAYPALRQVERFLSDCGPRTSSASDSNADQICDWSLLSARDICYRHTEGGPWILEHFTLGVRRGSLTVVVGKSGSGKSTLLDLLAGLLTPEHGDFVLDGRKLTHSDLFHWRETISYVPQDLHLLDDTIRSNLKLAAPHASDEDIHAALGRASIGTLIKSMPLGLDTRVGVNGAAFSGGERQRLAIARALLRSPKLLLLDEPTSSLDDENADAVLSAIENLKGHITIVLATHQPLRIPFADQVLDLNSLAGQVTVEV